ncbi:hypothetical protein ACQKNC_15925 [Lysinibacillus sp. NPDC094177]|uniref:hypothetical protein n=1 Tax=Lysinibacillus sp. NPDC094177 TaxID=3390580 RepID=UPI003D048FC6
MNLSLMSILSGKSFVMYNKELAHKVSANGAIIFGQLCSSYESFGSKGMLTVRDGKEYFFLTIETLEGETALSYKQQMKAIKDLEESGYIETRNMGVPQKRHFHITDKIVKELLSSSDKREELNTPSNLKSSPSSSTLNLDQRERLDLPKSDDNTCQKVSNIKKKNKKEKYKNIKDNLNCNYKEPLLGINENDLETKQLEPITTETEFISEDEFKTLLTNECNNLYSKFAVGRWNKKQWNTLIEKFVDDTISSGRYKNVPRSKLSGFAFKCLERIINNSDYKRSEEYTEYQEVMKEITVASSSPSNLPTGFYNWLEER